jgi:AbrB family looped-hinge helix DNA binding protein
MSKGQVTIPKEIRKLLKVNEGDRLTFICDGDYAIVMNANKSEIPVAPKYGFFT